MRKLVLALLALAAAAPAHADQASALAAVRDSRGVIDARMDSTGNLYAFVKPDPKVAWAQYAAYLCRVVVPHEGRIFRVRVVDITAANFNQAPAKWPRLGDADCGGR